jgi:hypothetical protein
MLALTISIHVHLSSIGWMGVKEMVHKMEADLLRHRSTVSGGDQDFRIVFEMFGELLSNFQFRWCIALPLLFPFVSLFCFCLQLVGVNEQWTASILNIMLVITEFA